MAPRAPRIQSFGESVSIVVCKKKEENGFQLLQTTEKMANEHAHARKDGSFATKSIDLFGIIAKENQKTQFDRFVDSAAFRSTAKMAVHALGVISNERVCFVLTVTAALCFGRGICCVIFIRWIYDIHFIESGEQERHRCLIGRNYGYLELMGRASHGLSLS